MEATIKVAVVGLEEGLVVELVKANLEVELDLKEVLVVAVEGSVAVVALDLVVVVEGMVEELEVGWIPLKRKRAIYLHPFQKENETTYNIIIVNLS